MLNEIKCEKTWVNTQDNREWTTTKADEYQRLALVTKSPESNGINWLTEALMGLSGESGEAIDLLKKHLYQHHELDRKNLLAELGDVAWYLAAAADALGYRLSDVFQANIEKLAKRYPNGFEAGRSISREESRRIRIVYYNSTKFEKTTTEYVKSISGTMTVDELTDADREMLRKESLQPMCNFQREDGSWIAVPWQFVVSIEEADGNT